MSDSEIGKPKAWTEHEVLVYLLSAIDHHGTKIDFHSAPAPAGRNASGCSQKMGKIKKALQAEIDAIQNGGSIAASIEATPKKTGGRKRKPAATGDDGEPTPKKRGRAKKTATSEPEVKKEVSVKDEPEGESDLPAEEV
ncbi:hypothetical protein BDU57DRAFT_529301 [Ampelomyces quisqualis]|uniref:Uncharacterized protein n=1 Tax=Ampelomyces quisqualis TaxID=50730 RepID=A0A6A5QKQ4_AMPQU|nr:hypothetical protein BDU57DRAFT_529301 [Ampelomyces quisqualis]